MYSFKYLLPVFHLERKGSTARARFFYKWANSWDYGTYHIGDQSQSHRCLHTWSLEVDERSDQKSDI